MVVVWWCGGGGGGGGGGGVVTTKHAHRSIKIVCPYFKKHPFQYKLTYRTCIIPLSAGNTFHNKCLLIGVSRSLTKVA